MEIEKTYSCLEQNSRVLQKCIEVDENYQESLQAYCDDLYRIIKCSSHSFVTSVDINYNEIKVFGKTEICVTYYDESSCLCYADFTEEFSKSFEVEGLTDSAFAHAKACDKYCSYRVINQRRIDVHSACSVYISIYDKQSCPCVERCDSSKIKTQAINCSSIVASALNKIEFDEEISIQSSNAIKRIINTSEFVSIEELKIIKDKALIKCKVNCCILYSLDNSNDIAKYEYCFSTSKIIDASGVDENSVMLSSVQVGNILFKLKSSKDDSYIVELYGDLSVSTLFIEQKEIDIVTDAYVLNHKSHCDYQKFTCLIEGKYIEKECQSKIEFDFGTEIKEIKDLCVCLDNESIKNGDLCARATAYLICINSEDELVSFTNTIDVNLDGLDCEEGFVSLSQISNDFNFSSNGKIEVRLIYKAFAYAYKEQTLNVLCDISADDNELKYPALTVYFGKKNETVWNIAKSFSSDVELIMSENELLADKLESNKILIIPGV